MAVDLPGVNAGDNELHISTDYGVPSTRAHRDYSNVQATPKQQVLPMAKQTLGRANQMFAFTDPLYRSTFLPDGAPQIEMPSPIRKAVE